ncbi:hypothetical protein ARALYDRAFT_918978 [Arabidopsis lyrata subsp. lyrata]|uniref:FBD domain-containing protein n=1 Tax=Arabidopsis lyrata subsp. lyrata TaxID=81972 RepID=D7MNX8_ARALL|nr:hypothetical protein ARALYDRAFT_918978 [Arabidopsis lyrata subsp. lyrata]
MPFLAEASLELSIRNLTRFLDAIKSANRLYLCLHRDITSAIPLVSFTQLHDLTLCTCGGDAWSFWLDLLQQCPEMRVLRFSISLYPLLLDG